MSGDFQISPNGHTLEEFHDKHRDKDGKRLAWMADFYRAKEGVIHYKKANLKWRIVELGKKSSWGNVNRHYFSDAGGHPLTQRQIASILDVDFQRVCEAIDELVSEGFLRKEGRILFVVDDPASARLTLPTERRRKSKGKSTPYVISGEERAKFYTFWAAQDAEQFQQYQTLTREIEEREREIEERAQKKKALSDVAWQAFQQKEGKSATGRTTETENPQRGGPNVRNGGDNLSGTGRTDADPNLIGFTSYLLQLASSKKGEPEAEVANALLGAQIADLGGNYVRAISAAATRLGGVPPQLRNAVLDRFRTDWLELASRRSNRPRKWGIIATLMEDAILMDRNRPAKEEPTQTHQPTADDVERWEATLIEQWEAVLADDTASAADKQVAANVLMQMRRKPAHSESSAKAQKAGQR